MARVACPLNFTLAKEKADQPCHEPSTTYKGAPGDFRR